MAEVQTRIDEDFEALANPAAVVESDPLAAWGPPTEVQEGLTTLAKTKIARTEPILQQTEQRLEEGRARALQAYEATGIQPGELEPWDQEFQAEKYATDPIQAFGSLGSVFAMIASAFTRDPMTNALSAGAAAMDAVRQGNELAFDRAFTAWKANNDLALKRHNIQQQSYQNALSLMDTDLVAGRTKLQMEAARFGDQKALMLLENGLDKELIDLVNSRAKTAQNMQQVAQTDLEFGLRRKAYDSAARAIDAETAEEIRDAAPIGLVGGDQRMLAAGKKLAAFQNIFGIPKNADLAVLGQFQMENPNATAEEVADFAQSHGIIGKFGTSRSMTRSAEITRRAEQYETDPNSPTYGDRRASWDRASKEVFAVGPLKSAEAVTQKWRQEFAEKNGREPTADEEVKFQQELKSKTQGLGTYKGTDAQSKSLQFATMLDRGIANIKLVTDEGYRPTAKDMFLFEMIENGRRAGGSTIDIIKVIASNYGLSEQAQRFYHGAREITAGILRPETGAAFGAGELTNTIQRYIDVPGDQEGVRENKIKARNEQRDVAWAKTGLPKEAWGLQAAAAALSGEPIPKKGEAAGETIPPPDKREAGRVYRLPKGEFEWTGTGWKKAERAK